MVRFMVGPEDQSGWGGVAGEGASEATIEVEMVRLDAVLDERIRVLKIDVEGADTLVLRGCEGLLKRRMIDQIFFEQNLTRMEKLGIEPGEARAFLQNCGYHCEPMGESSDE